MRMRQDGHVLCDPSSGDPRLGYLLAVPDGWQEQRHGRLPLVLFLHGSGERGNDLALVVRHGLPRLVAEERRFPFIVASPQCPIGSRWTDHLEDLLLLLDEVELAHPVDPDRVYVTGLSMGGSGTWALATASPERFAAIVPICGRGDPVTAGSIRRLPAWVFHGALDRTVPPLRAIEMVAALRATGADPRLTMYPDLAHNSWDQAYETPELYPWLLEQRRRPDQPDHPAGR